ncbi:MAG: hemolysin III family protein [Dietzia sp.]|uniref:PAQR family membrane homeostasis protein TrhA n=1 Tax=Dietzia TaxID=37914 RepID=UPI000D4A10A6|nr:MULTISPECIES: hemolysin III family protein [Dietzia]MDO8394632.1 hemolysin III family protein [Dietzia sp.]PTM86393.1 hemolysin III [Dietzia psychralcaliphila]
MNSAAHPRPEGDDDDFGVPALPEKPLLRGWIHAGTLPVAVVLGVVLTVLADGTALKWACAVFLATSSLLFGISALYHRRTWGPEATALLRRLDHSNIFLLIAGTYTPMTVAALDPPASTILLVIVWTGALIGIAFRLFWLSAPRWLYVVLYIVLGWTAVWFAGDLVEANLVGVALVVAGGVAYTGGAVVYGLKRPNPVPGVYGFHEVFHTCTVIAFACHWAAMFLFITQS